jgi:hypothetical protein
MTTVNTIEQRILQMDGGEFQKLCDAYLSAIGYGKPNSFGSVTGSNKVKKGTPDTFFERSNGKLVFAEYTTQQGNLFKKLSSDLGKCLNEKKTKVPISNLEEIVICYVSQLEPNEILSLKSKCKEKGVGLTLFGISALANDLLNHPLLVRNFLDLAIDTGQVIPLESFPSVYGKSKFATTLETKFHFREKEIEEFSNVLETYDLVIISGKAGVGKSRFALEGCRNFVAQHSEYKAYSIVSLSQNLYEDLQERFSLPGQFLILVDDANRVINFSYFMYILRNRKDNQQIKIVVTVRDYALDKIENDIFKHPYKSIQLDRLTDDQIKELAKDEFGILNPLFLERIVELSAGNPRIAVMISKVALEKNTWQSINDVSALYDEYFSSIKEDLQNFRETNLLRTAGIIAFLRAVDRTNEPMMSSIQSSFHISREVFWDCAFRLHELEMVDMYEDEVVRVSDQVLSTYLFYLAFFKERVLDFSDILQNYFPGFRAKINDSLFPTLNAFDQNTIFDLIRPKVQKTWNGLMSVNDDENLLALAEFFWRLLPTPTLSFIQKRLSQSQFAPADFSQLEQLDPNKINNVSIITELRILGRFRYTPSELRNVALELLLDYLNTRPAEILQILRILVDDYGFDRFSNQTGVSIQQNIVDVLWKRAENGQNELYSRLFIAVAGEYLKTHFQTDEMRSKMTLTMYSFSLQPSPEIFQLRTTIFDHLFEIYTKYQKYIFTVIQNYVNAYHHVAPEEIFSNDAISLIRFIQYNLTPQDYIHNIFVNDYLDFLENHNVVFDRNLREKFQNDAFLVYRLLSENRKEFIQYKYEEYQRIRKERFISYFASFSDIDIKHFIDLCLEIGSGVKQDHKRYEIISGFGIGLAVLAETRQNLFEVAISHYLQQGDRLGLHPIPFVRIFMTNYGKERTFTFLNELNYPTKKQWLFGYYQMLPSDKIGMDDLSSLYKLIQEAEYPQLPNHFDFLLNYIHANHRAVAKVAQLIIDKGNPQYSAWILNSITNPYSEMNKNLENLFRDDIETLKKVYLIVKSGRDHSDHNSATLSKLLKLDSGFIIEYLEWMCAPKEENSHWYLDNQDYSALWHHQNYREIFKKIVEFVYEKRSGAHWNIELRQFFKPDVEEPLEADIEQKQEQLLTELINARYQDTDFVEFLFKVIAYLSKERRSRVLFNFLQHNKKFGDFQKLELEPGIRSWSGSAVPIYQERIDYLKSLLPMLDSAQLLEHRMYIQQEIDYLETRKKLEKKQDFIGEDDI